MIHKIFLRAVICMAFLTNSALVVASGNYGEEDEDFSYNTVMGEQEMSSFPALDKYERSARALLLEMAVQVEANQLLRSQVAVLLNDAEQVVNEILPKTPQCKEYVNKAMGLGSMLKTIELERLEKDYHQDGILPQAPTECYHLKDVFVHAATVAVLMRDDPKLMAATRKQIMAEITEVLSHTDVVRSLL